jgi:hypothetical protein
MNDTLREQLATLLELKPGASDNEIISCVTAWSSERKAQQAALAFEGRLANLQSVTRMHRDEAIRCLHAQDSAGTPDDDQK